MDVQTVWKITRRWWWLALLPAVLIGAVGLLTYRPPPTTYAVTLRYSASMPPVGLDDDDPAFDPLHQAWLNSEYIVAGLSDWVRTDAFASAVSRELAASGTDLNPGTVRGALVSDYLRSTLVVYVTTGAPDTTLAISDAVTTVLQTGNAEAFPQMGGQDATVVPLETPTAAGANPPGLSAMLELVVRVGLGIAIGVALMFVAHFLDPLVREADDLQRLGIDIIGRIPRK